MNNAGALLTQAVTLRAIVWHFWGHTLIELDENADRLSCLYCKYNPTASSHVA